MKRFGTWQVYRKGDCFRVAHETRGGLDFYMLSNREPTIFYETMIRQEAFSTAKYLNTPQVELIWELQEE